MQQITARLNAIRVPVRMSKVWKEECALSFHTQESEGGVLVDMISWVCFSPQCAKLNFQKTNHDVYLNIKKKKILKKKEPSQKTETPKVLAIGVEGGFQTQDDQEIDEYTYAIVVLPSFESIPYPNDAFPEKVCQCVEGILKCDSAEKKEEVKAWVAGGSLQESNYAKNLVQLNTGHKIPQTNWTCDDCGGDGRTNLWLNLTDGHIGCGRTNFDGSGGKGHALEHFNKTRYPLVVKLGTITPEGADVHSYIEDDMVLDPNLEQHLKHWGLDMKSLTKTDKTLAEMEIELQHSFDFSRAQEKGAQLEPIYGPGFTGIQNLGNSCYMNSIMQVIFKIPEFIDRYYTQSDKIFLQSDMYDLPRNFHVQMCKFARGVLSGEHSKPPSAEGEEKQSVVRPMMFKSLIGEGHAEFATNRQQDALEFFQYLLQTIERKEHARGDGIDPSSVFQYSQEERLQCSSSGYLRYSISSKQNTFFVPIPIEKASNKAEVHAYNERQKLKSEEQKKQEQKDRTAEEPVWPRVTLADCFESLSATEPVSDWYSTAVKRNTTALKQKRFASFPKYLVLQMGRFVLTGLQLQKLEAFIDAPDELNLEHLRSKGLQPGEKELPSDEPEQIKLDEGIISTLLGMGFSRVRAEHAAYNSIGKGADFAMEWLFSHMDDAQYDIPLQLQKSGTQTSAVDEEAVSNLMLMGFDRPRCLKALQNTQNNVERAVEWLFSHGEDPMEEDKPAEKSGPLPDTSGRYKLFAFVTHMGKSTESGHYVCHILCDEKWVIYNDLKVAESQNPPRDMAYIYFYRRID